MISASQYEIIASLHKLAHKIECRYTHSKTAQTNNNMEMVKMKQVWTRKNPLGGK